MGKKNQQTKQLEEANELLTKAYFILNYKANQGCIDNTWNNFENGEGINIGDDINELIIDVRNYIYNHSNFISGIECT